MRSSLAVKFLIVLLTLSLVFGPSVVAPAMAMSAPIDSAVTATDLGDEMAQMDCCPSSHHDNDKHHAMDGDACAVACAAITQAIAHSFDAVPARYAAKLSFDFAHSFAVSLSSPPDGPPPKA